MIAFKFLRVLLSLSLVVRGTQAEFDTPPTNVTTGFVRLANATREISWFYLSNGLVVYDGDIIFGTTAEFNDALVNITHSPNDPSLSRRHDIPSQGLAKRAYSEWPPPNVRLWPGGIVFYRYFDSSVEFAVSAAVDSAISIWKNAVPCIHFVRLPNNPSPGGASGIVTIANLGLGYCATAPFYMPSTAMWLTVEPTGCPSPGPTMLHMFGI